MKSLLQILCIVTLIGSCALETKDSYKVFSPDKSIVFSLSNSSLDGLSYRVSFLDEEIFSPSKLGFEFANLPSFTNYLEVISVERNSNDSAWEQPWGENRLISDKHNEIAVLLRDEFAREVLLRVRAFNDGVGFRFEFGEGFNSETILQDELTTFNFSDPKENSVWWLKAYQKDRYEYRYNQSSLDEVTVSHTPMTLITNKGTHVSLHEAALVDYSSYVIRNSGSNNLKLELVPAFDGTKSTHFGQFKTPWRTIQISKNATGLVDSTMILNLNEPNKLDSIDWITTGKYMGIWWGMHIGENTWSTGPQLGATTSEALRYIDFIAEHGLDGLLIEGWNIGWDGNWMQNGPIFKFDQPQPFFEMDTVANYAKEKGVSLIMHNETSGDVPNYESQMGRAYDYLKEYGVHHLKTGYVGFANGYPFFNKERARPNEEGDLIYEWNHGQRMVNHYLKSVIEAAKREVAINAHEPIKPTGLRRTYPNMMTREGVRGQEYNAWSDGNDPQHATILPFTRMLGGPMDFTPGIFDVWFKGEEDPSRIRTTVAKQLALMVILYSPLQMAADLPRNYAKRLDVFQFIKDLGSDWEQSLTLDGEIAEYIVIAREEKESGHWFIGGITDENQRSYELDFSFLPAGNFKATIYSDGEGADWENNPFPVSISNQLVNSKSKITLDMASGGGFAISLIKE